MFEHTKYWCVGQTRLMGREVVSAIVSVEMEESSLLWKIREGFVKVFELDPER